MFEADRGERNPEEDAKLPATDFGFDHRPLLTAPGFIRRPQPSAIHWNAGYLGNLKNVVRTRLLRLL